MDIKILEANALDLSVLKSNSYDIVLLFGPLYHLQDIKNQILCIKEAKRVLKDDGKIFATFLNNDMVPLRESFFNLKYFESDNYDHETFDVFNFPYTCHL